MTELKRRPTTTMLVQLKEVIESFAKSMDEEKVKQGVRGIRRRARACLERNCAVFFIFQRFADQMTLLTMVDRLS